MTMSETNGTTGVAEKSSEQSEAPAVKKPRFDESVEERDFDEETQKALEEIDANQNEIDALNERKVTPERQNKSSFIPFCSFFKRCQ